MSNRIQYFEDRFLELIRDSDHFLLENMYDFQNPIRKYDGAPAVLMGMKDNSFFVATISYFNKTPKYYTSHSDIVTDNFISDDLKKVLLFVFRDNEDKMKNYPGIILWGDVLSFNGNYEISDDKIIFGANTIYYQMCLKNRQNRIVYNLAKPWSLSVIMWHSHILENGNIEPYMIDEVYNSVSSPFNLVANRKVYTDDVFHILNRLPTFDNEFRNILRNKFLFETISHISKYPNRKLSKTDYVLNMLQEKYDSYKSKHHKEKFKNEALIPFVNYVQKNGSLNFHNELLLINKVKNELLDFYDKYSYDNFTNTFVKDLFGKTYDCDHEGYVLYGNNMLKLISDDFLEYNKNRNIERVWMK